MSQKLDPEIMRIRRYARLNQIGWWHQDLLLKSRVMVVGAGATGNEVIKNLALLGVGKILIIDIDRIEDSNLTRSVLFRHEDVGSRKAEVAAVRASELNPDVQTAWTDANVVDGIGLGVFRRMDLVIGALDNREARLAVNRFCWKVGVPWLDTGLHTLDGQVRMFFPGEPPCYECTLTDADYEIIKLRRSCQLLKPDTMFEAIPTTPTIASIIGGVAVQEAVKYLHNREEYKRQRLGKGFIYHGGPVQAHTVKYSVKSECPSHDTLDEVEELRESTASLTLADLYKLARKRLGRKVVVDFEREIVSRLVCNVCGKVDEPFLPISQISPELGAHCGQVRDASALHSISGSEKFLSKSLSEIGIPPLDIVTARVGVSQFLSLELSGDESSLFDGLLSQ